MLLTPQDVQIHSRVLFSGRAVLAPGPTLDHDQVGLAEEMAWTLFGPLVIRETGDSEGVRRRSQAATRALDEIVAGSWAIVNRTPTVRPTSMPAFRPLRIPAPVMMKRAETLLDYD